MDKGAFHALKMNITAKNTKNVNLVLKEEFITKILKNALVLYLTHFGMEFSAFSAIILNILIWIKGSVWIVQKV